ncbi:MAG: HlyD family efflux transporter periplasmic adaptor subunit, partial [bacterium]
ITANPSDSVSSGASIGTIITKNNIADITVNEVDAAKITPGQKASLTFDAVDGLEISGVVQSIDLVGTVTQGVVNYNVKITFDVQDDRVKSGMSVSASIITNNKQDVIVVPNSAIKTKNGVQYVDMFSQNVATSTVPETVNETPTQQTVVVGLSNDTETEITSGLSVGDRIVTKTTTGVAATTKTSTAPSLFGSGGNKGGSSGGSIIKTGGAPAGR